MSLFRKSPMAMALVAVLSGTAQAQSQSELYERDIRCAELDQHSCSFAAYLQHLGLRRGDRLSDGFWRCDTWHHAAEKPIHSH